MNFYSDLNQKHIHTINNYDNELKKYPGKIKNIISELKKLFLEKMKKGCNELIKEEYSKSGINKNSIPEQSIGETQISGTFYDNFSRLEQRFATSIISFLEDLKYKDKFENNFRKIASTAVGRGLLYRLLIEIRRQDKKGEGAQGIDVFHQLKGLNITSRNRLRFIEIKNGKASFIEKDNSINFEHDDAKESLTVCKENKKGSYYEIKKYKRDSHVGLFHEMVHWFHYLRDKNRLSTEDASLENKMEELSRRSLRTLYYSNLDGSNDPAREKVSAETWQRTTGEIFAAKKDCVSYEEIRTILGSSKHINVYKNGDDISENLYRVETGFAVRFGHDDEEYMEDKAVINMVIKTLDDNKRQYGIIKRTTIMNCGESLNFNKIKKGIGSCKRKEAQQKSYL